MERYSMRADCSMKNRAGTEVGFTSVLLCLQRSYLLVHVDQYGILSFLIRTQILKNFGQRCGWKKITHQPFPVLQLYANCDVCNFFDFGTRDHFQSSIVGQGGKAKYSIGIQNLVEVPANYENK